MVVVAVVVIVVIVIVVDCTTKNLTGWKSNSGGTNVCIVYIAENSGILQIIAFMTSWNTQLSTLCFGLVFVPDHIFWQFFFNNCGKIIYLFPFLFRPGQDLPFSDLAR